MSHDLSQESLDDLLLSWSERRRSVDVLIESPPDFAVLRMHDGRLVDAEFGDRKGIGALHKILLLQEGRIALRENGGNGSRSFDVSVAEALISRSPARVHLPESSESGVPTQRGQPRPEPRFAQTHPGPVALEKKASPVGARTLLGFPEAQARKIISGLPPVQPAPRPHDTKPAAAPPRKSAPPPKHLAEPGARKLADTGYSSAPPAALAEERVVLPRGAISVKTLGGAPSESPKKFDGKATVALGSQIPQAGRETDLDTGPVSSLELDHRSLERLEALHEGISGTSHPIPVPEPGFVEEWPPSEKGTATSASTAPTSERGALPRVGRYEVLARLKSGGMGSVYLCRLSGSAGFRRLFAMKVLHQDLVHQPEVLELFFREANLLAQLHHPNIVGVVDVGSPDQPYLVLDYIEGGSLHELLRASPELRAPGVVVAIVLDALNGLSAVHQLLDVEGRPVGLVHNDISPHNLLIGVDGTCRVSDFGVARAREGSESEAARGKPSYMAPERLRGERFDHRADLFSLGVVLYVALTGVDPFAGATTAETLENVLRRSILPPSEVGLRPPPCFDWICMKALARSPADRFQSAEEMAGQLRRIAAREDLLVAPSVVAHWVRSTLGSTLEARRAAASKGLDPSELHKPSVPPPGVIAVGLSMSPSGILTSEPPPPSSSDFGDKTEILSSEEPLGVGPGAEEHDDPDRKKKIVLGIALGLSVAALVLVFLFPTVAARVVKRDGAERLTSDEAFEIYKEEALARRPAPSAEPVSNPAPGPSASSSARPIEPTPKGSEADSEIHLPAIEPRKGLR